MSGGGYAMSSHAILEKYARGSEPFLSPGPQWKWSDIYLHNSFGTNGEQHEKYKFYSLHFHWGRGNKNGSEHVFEGTTSTFEVHFVHYSSDYAALGDAVAAWDTLSQDSSQDMHTLGVVGFLFEEVGDDEEYNTAADAVLLDFATNEDMSE